MGVSLSYVTTEPVAADVRKTIEADAKRLNKQRPWWCENLMFYKDKKRAKHLTGDTKLFIVGIGDDIDDDDDDIDDDDEGADGEAASDNDQFMGFHDARFILLTLAQWSRAHGVSWVVEMAGEEVARVSGGRIEPPGLFEADAPVEQLRADDERARAILAKYPER